MESRNDKLLSLNAKLNNELQPTTMAEEGNNVPFMDRYVVQAKFDEYQAKINTLELTVRK